jgi:hypothetical protein
MSGVVAARLDGNVGWAVRHDIMVNRIPSKVCDPRFCGQSRVRAALF